ncbi:hypothetical protein PC9H_006797 [Pleurotus ostreatus]|uniref:Uncharacterized protein n=1 Tax=Pleurotus ostreatus TaxID=5322 RepID=A0A8H6ZUG9_PLEOS|nr:uncharacterized protein PC9H_006797 [Pleurotus ostreatus]KAF7431079.1 hypothetical protein PC9H_006797 [Pleurotus ostreatus]KAJ8695478.1 hypothetical protein PTI98_008079 [Pleurotus ostreatus]
MMSDSPTKPHIALVGTYSDDFVKALQVDNFDVERCDTIPDPKTCASALTVLALTDGDHTLSENDINVLLRARTVLALFRPSRALLETVHKATNTPIDIPSLELADELPLLVYIANGVVHITSNNVPSEAKVHELVQGALEKDGKAPPDESFSVSTVAVEPHEQAVLSISRAVSAAQNLRAFVSNLDPPTGVIGFKKGTLDNTTRITITWLAWRRDGHYNVTTTDPAYIQKYDLNWYTDFYSYATGTDCRGKTAAEFTNAGGVVYTVAIDRGSLRRSSDGAPRFLGPTSGYCGYYFVDCHRTGNHAGSSMRMLSYQPRGLDSQSGTTYNYSIDFQQDMQMFNNNGNSTYTFKAQYSNGFGLDRFQQHQLQDSAGVDFSVDYKDYYDHWVDPEFDTQTWWNPGVYEKVNREGWEHWIVREYLPADNIPINGLTLFSSSVGKHTLTSKYRSSFSAFKSNAWRTTSDDSTTHFQVAWTSYSNGSGWSRTLDLTWSL